MARAVALLVLVAGCSFQAHSPGASVDGNGGGDTSNGDGSIVDDAGGEQVHRIDVTGTVSGGPHADFPVLVAITETWLRDTASGGAVTSSTGADIRFFGDAGGAQLLAYEIERYTPATGELVAWVKLPQLATATSFYVRAGNAAITTSQENAPGVWSSSFAGVWHLSSVGESTGVDATSEAGSTDSSDTAAKIADGRAFNSAMLSAGNATQVTDVFATGGTAEAWVYATGGGGGGFGRIFDKGPSYMVLSTCETSATNSLLFGRTFTGSPGDWCTAANSLPASTWTHVAVTFDDRSASNVPAMYINGAAVQLGSTTNPSGTAYTDGGGTLTIGDRTSTGRAFAGTLDELRLIRSVRTAGWIATEYANQADPTGFLHVN